MPKKLDVVIPLHRVGLHPDTIPTINDELTEGTVVEVREHLRSIGERLKWGNVELLMPAEYTWLGKALIAIAGGVDANKALRVKGKKKYGPRYILGMPFLIEELRRQGMTKKDATALCARLEYQKGKWRLRDDPNDTAGDALEQLLKRSHRK